MKKDKPDILKNLNVLGLANWYSTFAIVALFVSITPALFAQRDVHASLIALADRKPAPVLQLTSETGQTTRLSDYRGKVILLNFWASECGGCILEIPSIIDIQAAYKEKPFTVVGQSKAIYRQEQN